MITTQLIAAIKRKNWKDTIVAILEAEGYQGLADEVSASERVTNALIDRTLVEARLAQPDSPKINDLSEDDLPDVPEVAYDEEDQPIIVTNEVSVETKPSLIEQIEAAIEDGKYKKGKKLFKEFKALENHDKKLAKKFKKALKELKERN
jgi:hypothetical protein